jgi:hypothetical protein
MNDLLPEMISAVLGLLVGAAVSWRGWLGDRYLLARPVNAARRRSADSQKRSGGPYSCPHHLTTSPKHSDDHANRVVSIKTVESPDVRVQSTPDYMEVQVVDSTFALQLMIMPLPQNLWATMWPKKVSRRLSSI